jgi:hypothetical protein
MSNAFSRFKVNRGSIYNSVQTGQIASYVTGIENNDVEISEEQQFLLDSAATIQALLNQLESDNPLATEAEQIAYVSDETSPSFKRRLIKALKAGSTKAVQEHLDRPSITAIVHNWMDSE